MARACSIDGCERKHVARGYCRTHYKRWWATGDPIPTRLYRAPLADRLQSKLAPGARGCQEFTGWRDEHGYGRFKVDGQMRKPHRVAYEIWVGPIPDGVYVCHRCDNPSCCNPEHLFLGTQGDNMRDMATKGRGNSSGLARIDLVSRSANVRARAARIRAESAVAAGHPSDYKRCSRCDQYKAPAQFGRNACKPDGLQTYCHPCQQEYVRARTLIRRMTHGVPQGQ